MRNQHLITSEYFTQRSQRSKERKERHVERQRNISLIESFSIRRSFAYAQNDATEICGAGPEKRAERDLT
jgi:hypothetical protein